MHRIERSLKMPVRLALAALLAAPLGTAPGLLSQEGPPAGEAAVPRPAPASEVILETTRSSDPFPSLALDRISFLPAPRGEESRGKLALGDATVEVEDVLFLRFTRPRPPAANSVRVLLILRAAPGVEPTELAGVVGGIDPREREEDTIRFLSPAIVPGAASSGAPAEAAPGVGLLVPLEKVKGLVVLALGSPGEEETSRAARAARLKREVARAQPRKDELILLQGGRAEGVLEALLKDGVRFGSERLGDVTVLYEKIQAVILADVSGDPDETGGRAPVGEAAPNVRVSLPDGSRIAARLRALASGKLTLDHAQLGPLEIALDDVAELAFLGGRASYLSDLDPIRVKEELGAAYFPGARPHHRDENVLGGPMRMRGRVHRKGLGVHSYSLLEYDIGGNFSRFQATIGLDDSARPSGPLVTGVEGSVTFRVKVDGELLLEKPLTWRDAPERIDVPIQGRKVLALEVDYGAPAGPLDLFNTALDRANWGDARVVK
ncbi:MAG TPA: NPCBM/NEW2 domain-containing protein [Planctomycetota bacterium]|nr:NPCBM/NEW2 domain-containing protein [Planctomycetota bacterium]